MKAMPLVSAHEDVKLITDINPSIIDLSLRLLALEFVFEAFIALDTQDGQAAVLAGLCQPEEDGPQYALCRNADGQQHLGKGQDVERDAAQQHDDTGPE